MTLLLTAAVVRFVKRQRGEGPPPEQRENNEEEAPELQDTELSTVTSTERMGWQEMAAFLEDIF
jgi:hypothetical protein